MNKFVSRPTKMWEKDLKEHGDDLNQFFTNNEVICEKSEDDSFDMDGQLLDNKSGGQNSYKGSYTLDGPEYF